MEFDFAPMRYFFPLTRFDSPSSNSSDPPSARNANLLDMYISKKTELIGRQSNQGYNRELAVRLIDHSAWSYLESATDSASVQSGAYKLMPGQIVPLRNVSQLTLSRNAYISGIGNEAGADDTLFGPIYTPDARVAGMSDTSVALWSVARIGMPAPAPMAVPGVCCGDNGSNPYAHGIRIPKAYIIDNQQATSGNQYNCCTPTVLSVVNNGDFDAETNTLHEIEAFEDFCTSDDADYSPTVADGFFNKNYAYNDLVCNDNSTSPEIGADATPASSICGTSGTYSARAFCDYTTRSDSASSSSVQEGYLVTMENMLSGAVADSMILAVSNANAVSSWLNCDAPYSTISQYNMQVDGGGSLSVARERRMRAMYLRFIILDQMKDGTDLSVASDFRELVTFNDKRVVSLLHVWRSL